MMMTMTMMVPNGGKNQTCNKVKIRSRVKTGKSRWLASRNRRDKHYGITTQTRGPPWRACVLNGKNEQICWCCRTFWFSEMKVNSQCCQLYRACGILLAQAGEIHRRFMKIHKDMQRFVKSWCTFRVTANEWPHLLLGKLRSQGDSRIVLLSLSKNGLKESWLNLDRDPCCARQWLISGNLRK